MTFIGFCPRCCDHLYFPGAAIVFREPKPNEIVCKDCVKPGELTGPPAEIGMVTLQMPLEKRLGKRELKMRRDNNRRTVAAVVPIIKKIWTGNDRHTGLTRSEAQIRRRAGERKRA